MIESFQASFHLEYNNVTFLIRSHLVDHESKFLNRTTGGEEDRGRYQKRNTNVLLHC